MIKNPELKSKGELLTSLCFQGMAIREHINAVDIIVRLESVTTWYKLHCKAGIVDKFRLLGKNPSQQASINIQRIVDKYKGKMMIDKVKLVNAVAKAIGCDKHIQEDFKELIKAAIFGIKSPLTIHELNQKFLGEAKIMVKI